MVSLYHCPGIAGYLIFYIISSLLWMSFIGSILDTLWRRRPCPYPFLPADRRGGWGLSLWLRWSTRWWNAHSWRRASSPAMSVAVSYTRKGSSSGSDAIPTQEGGSGMQPSGWEAQVWCTITVAPPSPIPAPSPSHPLAWFFPRPTFLFRTSD